MAYLNLRIYGEGFSSTEPLRQFAVNTARSYRLGRDGLSNGALVILCHVELRSNVLPVSLTFCC